MTQEGQLPPPPVLWAQRKDILFVTICLEECKDHVIKIEPEKIYFQGVGGTEKKKYEVTINLYKEIDPDKSIQNLRGRSFELVLSKKEDGPYWPRLTKEKKAHWLKSDFNKWKDEDDSDDEDDMGMRDLGSPNMESMMRKLGGLGVGDDSKPNFDDLDDGEGVDSDDEEMPDLE
ncbi:prostaglandin E synthase 3 [Prorops nasuta]|uniref:prostaglandin E synthase 3 n=1 Tax=Prorops nasuta TaxID=863751 RepID=UPI0034D015D9